MQAEIEAGKGKILLISFGALKGALRWMEEMKSPFPMLLDHDRQVNTIISVLF